MARSIFITATDTGAGKTYLTRQLVGDLLSCGIRAVALKPVASGLDADGTNEDVEALLEAQHLNDADAVNLYRFRLAAAPSLAARAEGAMIDPDKLVRWCRDHAEGYDVCLIEGVGGLMVPLTDDLLVEDWLQAMPECEVWLVVSVRLGAINHTLLTLEQLRRMNRLPALVILNAVEACDERALSEMRRIVSRWSSVSRCITTRHGESMRWAEVIHP